MVDRLSIAGADVGAGNFFWAVGKCQGLILGGFNPWGRAFLSSKAKLRIDLSRLSQKWERSNGSSISELFAKGNLTIYGPRFYSHA